MTSTIGSGSGETSITASPISLTILTGGSSASPASRVSRPATLPSSSTGTLSPSAVKPTRSAKAITACWVSSSLPGAALLLRERVAAQDLLQVQREDVLEPRAGERHQLLGDRPVAVGELVLVEAGLDERLGDERARGLGVAGHALAEHARDLERVLVGEPGLAVQRCRARVASRSVSP